MSYKLILVLCLALLAVLASGITVKSESKVDAALTKLKKPKFLKKFGFKKIYNYMTGKKTATATATVACPVDQPNCHNVAESDSLGPQQTTTETGDLNNSEVQVV